MANCVKESRLREIFKYMSKVRGTIKEQGTDTEKSKGTEKTGYYCQKETGIPTSGGRDECLQEAGTKNKQREEAAGGHDGGEEPGARQEQTHGGCWS